MVLVFVGAWQISCNCIDFDAETAKVLKQCQHWVLRGFIFLYLSVESC